MNIELQNSCRRRHPRVSALGQWRHLPTKSVETQAMAIKIHRKFHECLRLLFHIDIYLRLFIHIYTYINIYIYIYIKHWMFSSQNNRAISVWFTGCRRSSEANFSDRLRVLQESWQAANEVGKRQMTEAGGLAFPVAHFFKGRCPRSAEIDVENVHGRPTKKDCCFVNVSDWTNFGWILS